MTMEQRQKLRVHFRRSQISVGLVALLLATISLAVVLGNLGYTYIFGNEFAPLYGEGYSPNRQLVRSEPTKDSTLQPVHAGDNIYTWATKCSHEAGLGVSGSGTLRKLAPPPLPPPPQITAGSRISTVGCVERSFITRVPLDTQPGTYVLTGVDQAQNSSGTKVQTKVWQTQEFEVVP